MGFYYFMKKVILLLFFLFTDRHQWLRRRRAQNSFELCFHGEQYRYYRRGEQSLRGGRHLGDDARSFPREFLARG